MTEVEKPGALLGEALLNTIRVAVREEICAALKISEYGGQADRLLDIEEAWRLLGVSQDWLYRHARRLPFTRRLGAESLRFSYQGMHEWIKRRNF